MVVFCITYINGGGSRNPFGLTSASMVQDRLRVTISKGQSKKRELFNWRPYK